MRRSSGLTRVCIRAAARALCSFLCLSGCVASLGKYCTVVSPVNATGDCAEPLHQLCSPQSPGQLFFVVSLCNIISCAHHSLQVCCKCLPCSSNRLLRFTGYEPRALGLSVDCSSVEGPVDVSRTRLDRLGPTYSSCVDYILSHHHLLTILPAQDQFTTPDRFTRSAPIFAGSLVVVPSLS